MTEPSKKCKHEWGLIGKKERAHVICKHCNLTNNEIRMMDELEGCLEYSDWLCKQAGYDNETMTIAFLDEKIKANGGD